MPLNTLNQVISRTGIGYSTVVQFLHAKEGPLAF